MNEYLRTISGRDVTAKDFRTWAATNLALIAFGAAAGEAPSKHTEVAIVKRVAQQLGNTPSVCRKSYIHPAVIRGYYSQTLQDDLATELPDNIPDVWIAERKMIRFLRRAVTSAE